MEKSVKDFCIKAIKKQLAELGDTTVTANVIQFDSVSLEKRDDMGLRVQAIEESFFMQQVCINHERRIEELEDLLEKAQKGNLSLICKCGKPITVEMFKIHASEECTPCRGKKKAQNPVKHINFIGAPVGITSDNPFNVYASKDRIPKRK